MKARCLGMESTWDLFLDGGLDPVRAAEIREHLPDCPACRRELAAERELRATLGALPVSPVPDRLAAEIARIPEIYSGQAARPKRWLSREPSGPGPIRHRPGRTFRWSILAASLAIATFWLFRLAGPQTGEETAAYSDQAIRRARAQATWCLALTARVLRDSEKQAVTEVFGDKLPRAVRSTLLRPTDETEGGQG